MSDKVVKNMAKNNERLLLCAAKELEKDPYARILITINTHADRNGALVAGVFRPIGQSYYTVLGQEVSV